MDPYLEKPDDPNPRSFAITALIGPGSMKNALYSMDLEGWHFVDKLFCMFAFREFKPDTSLREIDSAVRELETVLLAIFVNDHIPRKILWFNYPADLPDNRSIQLTFSLGSSHELELPDQSLTAELFFQQGWIHINKASRAEEEEITDVQQIRDWYGFLRQNKPVAASIALIQQSFVAINRLSGSSSYHDFTDLSMAVILLVSGLESLFSYKSEDKADIAFKFRTVGALYYSKFATDGYLKRFGDHFSKLGGVQFREVLKFLYDVRSDIAHGRSPVIFHADKDNIKRWNKFLGLLNINGIHGGSAGLLTQPISMALGMLEKHIFALIYCSREHLTKGATIIDEYIS